MINYNNPCSIDEMESTKQGSYTVGNLMYNQEPKNLKTLTSTYIIIGAIMQV